MNSITKEDLILKVNSGESVTIADNRGNSFNIQIYNEFYIKIYPLYSTDSCLHWYKFDGMVAYPLDYDPRWISSHTIKIPTLRELLV